MSSEEEYKSLILEYPEEHDLFGYQFRDFVALDGGALQDFLIHAKFKHRGALSRIHKASSPTQGRLTLIC